VRNIFVGGFNFSSGDDLFVDRCREQIIFPRDGEEGARRGQGGKAGREGSSRRQVQTVTSQEF
jgi:hypothetical protein